MPLRGGMLWRLKQRPPTEDGERRLRALAHWLAVERGGLADGERIVIEAVEYSTRPDDRALPPLRRERLFAYHAPRRDEPPSP
jgi:hypothetical protein